MLLFLKKRGGNYWWECKVHFFCRSAYLVQSLGGAVIVSHYLLHGLFAVVLTAFHATYILPRPESIIQESITKIKTVRVFNAFKKMLFAGDLLCIHSG